MTPPARRIPTSWKVRLFGVGLPKASDGTLGFDEREAAAAAESTASRAIPMRHSGFYEYFTRHRSDVVAIALLFGAILVAYLPAMDGTFIWDDEAHVTRPDLRSLHGLWRIWFEVGATQQYYPLLHSAFWFEHRLWGDAPAGYHVVNVLQHAFAVCLLLAVLRRLQIPGALLAAAIFALHPVHTESVAWIAEQKNTLSAVFYLSAMLAYLRFDEERGMPPYALASTFFALALLTKTVTASLPAALLVIFWWQRGRVSWPRDVMPLLPWFAMGAAAGLFTAWVERTLIGAQGPPFELTLLQRCLLAGRVIWFYAGKLFWPVDLMLIYPRWAVDPAVWWHYLFAVGGIVVVSAAWLIRRRWRGPLAALLFYIGSLFPVLGFFNVFPFVFSFVANHFQYLSSLGIIVGASAGIALTLERVPKWARWAGRAPCIAMLGVLVALTWQQSRTYRDPQTLYATTLNKNPECWMCRNNLGILLDNMGQPYAAIEQFESVLSIKPDDAFTHNNLGKVRFQAGQVSAAVDHLEQAVRLKPNNALFHTNLGSVLIEAGRLAEAVDHLQQAVKLKPQLDHAHYMLGNALLLMDRVSEAREQYEWVLRINPNHPQARSKLSQLRAR